MRIIIHEKATNDGKGFVKRMVRNKSENFIKCTLNHTKSSVKISIIYTV